jgi:hypothetical protein
VTEAHLTRDVIAYLKALRQSGRKVWWVKLHGGAMQRSGVPDLLIVIDGRVVFVELKATGEEPSRLQEHILAQIEAAGGTAEWVDNLDDFKMLVS